MLNLELKREQKNGLVHRQIHKVCYVCGQLSCQISCPWDGRPSRKLWLWRLDSSLCISNAHRFDIPECFILLICRGEWITARPSKFGSLHQPLGTQLPWSQASTWQSTASQTGSHFCVFPPGFTHALWTFMNKGPLKTFQLGFRRAPGTFIPKAATHSVPPAFGPHSPVVPQS